MLECRGRADVCEVVKVSHGAEPARIGRGISDAPTCNGKCLREAGNDDGAFLHAWQGSGADVPCAIVDEVLVNLVCNEEQAVCLHDFCNGFQFGEREDLAAGICRRIEHQCAGARSDGRPQRIDVESPVGFGQGNKGGSDAHGLER